MKSIARKRLARLAALLLLSFVVVATGVQAAQAAYVEGSGGGNTLPPRVLVQLQKAHRNTVAPRPLTGRVPVPAFHKVPSGTALTSIGIIGAVGSVLLVTVVALVARSSRRRQPGRPASVTSISPPADGASTRRPESPENSRRRAA
jgi:hypothetical protein